MFSARYIAFAAARHTAPRVFAASQTSPAVRRFSCSHRAQKSDDEEMQEMRSQLSQSKMFEKLGDKPDALEAISEFANVLAKMGVDPTKRPSSITMMRLVSNPEFRQQAMRLVDVLKAEGIDASSKEMMDELFGDSKKKPDSS